MALNQQKIDEAYSIFDEINEFIPGFMQTKDKVVAKAKFDPTGLRVKLEALVNRVEILAAQQGQARITDEQRLNELHKLALELREIEPQSEEVTGVCTFQELEVSFDQEKFEEQVDALKKRVTEALGKPDPEVQALEDRIKAVKDRIKAATDRIKALQPA